jgi:hypothetical protein
MYSFAVAERVTILNETGIYEVLALGGEYLLLKDEFGFERKVAISLVCKTKQIEVKKLVQKDLETTRRKASSLQEMPHLDLHRETLEERGVVFRHDDVILHVQLKEFKRFCNQMIEQRQTRFRVVHGIGNGILRQEIRAIISGRKGFQLHDDQVSFGRVGASLVEIRLNEVEHF